MIILEYQDIKIFLDKVTHSWSEEVFVIKMFMLLVILMVKTWLEPFTKGITKQKQTKTKTKRILEFKKY